jgi:putative nucleotidyltransferase with HDIG domain
LICITLVAGFSLATALLAADRIVTDQSMGRSAASMRSAQAVFYRLARQRADFAADQIRLIAELPILHATLDLGNPATISEMAEEYRQKLRAEFCIVTNAKGRWLGKPGWPGSMAPPPALLTGIGSAQAGQSYQGYIVVGRQLFLVAAEPARFGEEVLGTLTAGYPLDDAVAAELAQMTGCEVTFAFQGRLCGSSLRGRARGALEGLIKAVPPAQLPSPRMTLIRQLAGSPYVSSTCALLPGAPAAEDGRLLLLQPWGSTQKFLESIKAALAMVLGIAFAVALGGGLVITRRITRPLRAIVAVAEEVAAGDWERQASQEGSSEVAVMAAAFNHMTASLRHWRQEAELRAECLAETLEQLQQAHRATLEALSRALDARDNETEGHSLRVAHYATCLARQMGLQAEPLSALRWGALLHDIGKVGVPDAILHKPGRLTPEETAEMQRHCAYGLEIVRGIPYLERAADVIGCHHERYDGQGYPNRLAGEQVPLAARIFAVADTLDAITSDRPYRGAGSFSDALAEIRNHSGTQFDPRVVAALEAIIEPLREWRREFQPGEALPPTALEAAISEVVF